MFDIALILHLQHNQCISVLFLCSFKDNINIKYRLNNNDL